MATALDSPIPPNRNPSFRLTEYYINDLTITDSLLVNHTNSVYQSSYIRAANVLSGYLVDL